MFSGLMKAAGLLALGLGPAAARAATICSAGSLVVCVDFSITPTSGSNYNLTVKYVSSNGTGGVLADFGIDGPNALNLTAVSVTPSSRFSLGPTNCSLQDNACASAKSPGPQNGLAVGESAVLSFTSSSGDFGTAFENAHLIGFSPECSVKIGTGNQYETQGTNGGSANLGGTCRGTTTTTPEPASVLLIGSGLAGVGGVVRRRRRKS